MRSFAMAALACLGALAGWHWEIFQNWDLSAMSRLIKTPEPPTQQVEVRAGAALAEDVGTRQPPSSQNSSMPPLAPHVPSESPEPEAVVDPASEVEPQAHNDPPVPRV